MYKEAPSSKNNGDYFTMIPHSVFEWLLTTDLSKREQKVTWLVARLQYGCRFNYGAEFRQAELFSVGILPSHAKAIIQGLLEKRVLIKDRMSKRYVLNVPPMPRDDVPTYMLRRLIHRNSYRKGNYSTTISVTSKLPKQEVKSNQKGNIKKLPEQELNRSTNAEIHSAKDNKRVVNTDKDKKVGGRFVNPATFSPGNELEVAAFETWQVVEPENSKSFRFYLNLIEAGLGVDDFYRIRAEVMQDPSNNNRGELFNHKAREFIKQHLAERSGMR